MSSRWLFQSGQRNYIPARQVSMPRTGGCTALEFFGRAKLKPVPRQGFLGTVQTVLHERREFRHSTTLVATSGVDLQRLSKEASVIVGLLYLWE